MKFKLIIVMTQDGLSEQAIEAARARGATGCTTITAARGEGLNPAKSFFGLSVTSQRDMLLFLVEEHKACGVLEGVADACRFEQDPGAGVAFQLDIEDAIGLTGQIASIETEISKEDL